MKFTYRVLKAVDASVVIAFVFTGFFICLTCHVNAQGLGVNSSGTAADPSAIFDASSTTKGQLMPRMTTTQRNAISSPAEGLQIFNTTTKCFEYYAYGVWQTLGCATCPTPASTSAGTHTSTASQITWNWTAVPGVTGYKWNTANSYNTATDNGSSTTYTQTGLTCNTSYTLYVWTYNSCGGFAQTVLTQSTLACPFTCGSSTVSHGYVAGVSPANSSPFNGTYTYNTVSGNTYPALTAGKCWITKNVGATAEATSSTDTDPGRAGWYFQFNRRQGYYYDGTGRTPNSAWPSINEISNWTQANDPCNALFGSTWRIPTQAELSTYRSASAANGGMNNGIIAAAYSSPLKLHAAGYLNLGTGALTDRGVNVYYWDSNQNSNGTGSALYIEGTSGFFDYNQSEGFSLRCIKD